MNIPDGHRLVPFEQGLKALMRVHGGTAEEALDLEQKRHDVESTAVSLAKVVGDILGVSRAEALEKIIDMERRDLITFSVTPTQQPAIFIQPDEQFTSTEDMMAARALLQYFEATGDYDSQTTEMIISVETWASRSTEVVREMADELHISPRLVVETMLRFEQHGWIKILVDGKTAGSYLRIVVHDKDVLQPTDRRVIDVFRRLFSKVDNSNLAPPKVFTTSEYMRAVEAQYAMLSFNDTLVNAVADPKHPHHHGLDEWKVTSQFLRAADTYCWFHDPEVAVQAAAATLPSSFKLGREILPISAVAGFWYFADAIEVATVVENKPIKALLWGWEVHAFPTEFGPVNRFGLTLEAAIEDNESGTLIPTVRFFWREGLTLAEMIASQRREFLLKYSDDPVVLKRLELNVNAMEYMARFFASGALWMEQRVLVTTTAPVERHFRKRAEKQHKTTVKSMVIVQLRRRQSVSEAAPGSSKSVDWKCRWTVSGHWRNQPYKTTGKIETIWIDAYVKGPDDKPFRDVPKKIFAVKR